MILLIAGLVLLLLGIALVVASPSLVKVSWEQREKPIEENFNPLPKFMIEEKSRPLVSRKIVIVKPWYFKSFNEWHGIYDYCFVPLYIFEDAKDIVIEWNAFEHFSKIFNFYVLDRENFYLWMKGESFKAFEEETGSSAYSFILTFNKEEELPDSFYCVVEVPKNELKPEASREELKRVIEVNAIASWTKFKESYKEEYIDSYYLYYTFGTSERRNFVIKGITVEKNGNNFNFYIMDSYNCENFWNDKPYLAHYEKKGISLDSFSVKLTEEQLKDVFFVVENPNTNINETITLKAKLTYEEKVTNYSTSNRALLLGSASAILGFILIVTAIVF
ncbi:MAG: hypothetical protein ACP5H3_04090 [Candidatus Aenigmatarchaeota archaeon]